MTTGAAPFQSDTPWRTMEAQCSEPLPALVTTRPVPKGFEGWVRRLLAKQPRDRFRRAADAAWALLSLDDDGVEQGEMPDEDFGRPEATLDSSTTITLRCMEDEARVIEMALSGASVSTLVKDEDGGMPVVVPPLPARWGRQEAPTASVRMAGAGLNLLGMRSIPLVDREPERDALWTALRQVKATGSARLALLRGASGCGKSRIAEWLCERAHEVGGGSVMRAFHGPVTGPAHGLGPMVARFLRTTGLGRDQTLERIARLLTTWGAPDLATHRALTQLVMPKTAEETDRRGAIRFSAPGERYAVLYKLLCILGKERPVILWLEDAQWGVDSLGFADYILDIQERFPSPVLIIMTAVDELLADRPAENTLIRSLRRREDSSEVLMSALGRVETSRMLTDLIGLDARLTTRIEPVVAGSPLFATQLIGHWAQQGLLVPGHRGFRLSNEDVELPDDLETIWTAKVDGMLDGRAHDDRVALEVAAVLGQAGVADEMDDVCKSLGIKPSETLIDALMACGLARGVEKGVNETWEFAHRTLLESLTQKAAEAGRVEKLHRACAETLRRRGGPGAHQRVGLHHLASGNPEAALEPLLVGAREHLNQGRDRHAIQLMEKREEALTALGVPHSDQRWGEGWEVSIRANYLQGEFDTALRMVQEFEHHARHHDWDPLLPVALTIAGEIHHRMGDYVSGEVKFTEAIELAHGRGDRATLGRARRELGKATLSRGQADRALRLARLAREDFEQLGSVTGAGRAILLESFVTKQHEQWEETRKLLHQALGLFEESGYLRGMSDCHNQLGELARLSDHLGAAERHYRNALSLCQATGAGETIIPEINLSLTLLAQGRYDAARGDLLRALGMARRQKRKHLIGCIRAVLLCCDAYSEDWEAWDDAVKEIEKNLKESGFVDTDIARCARLAGKLAAKVRQFERAQWAFRLSRDQFRALKLHADANGIEYTLKRLPK